VGGMYTFRGWDGGCCSNLSISVCTLLHNCATRSALCVARSSRWWSVAWSWCDDAGMREEARPSATCEPAGLSSSRREREQSLYTSAPFGMPLYEQFLLPLSLAVHLPPLRRRRRPPLRSLATFVFLWSHAAALQCLLPALTDVSAAVACQIIRSSVCSRPVSHRPTPHRPCDRNTQEGEG